MGHVRLRLGLPILAAALLVSGTAQAAHRARGGHVVAATPSRPETFGVDDYTVTSLSDLSFTPFNSSETYDANVDDYFRWLTTGGSFVTGAVIPAGAVIDFVGLGSCDEAGGNWSLALYDVAEDGTYAAVADIASTAHGAATPCIIDYNAAALGYLLSLNATHSIQVEVTQAAAAPVDGSTRFSSVEIWWHRSVSPAPAVATFNDVPTDHPFFQYIEALAASGITGGCGSGNYCPDAPLTRGQMAVFLAKALGLHWTGLPPI